MPHVSLRRRSFRPARRASPVAWNDFQGRGRGTRPGRRKVGDPRRPAQEQDARTAAGDGRGGQPPGRPLHHRRRRGHHCRRLRLGATEHPARGRVAGRTGRHRRSFADHGTGRLSRHRGQRRASAGPRPAWADGGGARPGQRRLEPVPAARRRGGAPHGIRRRCGARAQGLRRVRCAGGRARRDLCRSGRRVLSLARWAPS